MSSLPPASAIPDGPGRADHRPAPRNLLNDFPVQAIRHFGRPLAEHLVGCHDLLVRWGAPDTLCRAGLFHSIYGTATFREAAVPAYGRARIAELIGAEAEVLVHFFCFGDRRRLMLDNVRPPYVWTDHRDGSTQALAEAEFQALVLLEVANFVEQLPYIGSVPDAVIDDMEHRLRHQDRWYSAQVRADLAAALAARRSLRPAR
jgi:hypothetical protein